MATTYRVLKRAFNSKYTGLYSIVASTENATAAAGNRTLALVIPRWAGW